MTGAEAAFSSRSRGLSGRPRGGDQPARVECQICGAQTVPGLDLGQQPVSDLILSRAQLDEPETFYPMRLHHCTACGLTQLSYVVDPRVVYKHFPFVSGTTRTTTRHLQSLPARLVKLLGLGRRSFAVDIGSNDGTLLKGYLPYGVRFLGVDPAGDPVRIANQQGIETLHAFFNEETAAHVRERYGRADAITACGVFGHMADLSGVMKGVKLLLKRGGVFATDSQYWLDMVERLHYDNVFHQHLRYYSLKPLRHLFRRHGMDVFDVERSEIHGGSIRVYACHAGDFRESKRTKTLEALEQRRGLYSAKTWRRFERAVKARRRRFFGQVYSLAAKGKSVVGIGAPAKAATICNYCRLGPELVPYVTEVNPLRIGKFLPGVHIPIVEERRLFEAPMPDAGILFAWNYYGEIVPKLRARGFRGRILLP